MKLNNKSYKGFFNCFLFFFNAITVLSYLPTIFINKQQGNVLFEIPMLVNFFFINSACIAVEITVMEFNAAHCYRFWQERFVSLRGDLDVPIDRDNLMKK